MMRTTNPPAAGTDPHTDSATAEQQQQQQQGDEPPKDPALVEPDPVRLGSCMADVQVAIRIRPGYGNMNVFAHDDAGSFGV